MLIVCLVLNYCPARTGLLAGLHEFPTLANVSSSTLAAGLTKIPEALLLALLQGPLCPYEPKSSKSSRTKATVKSTTDDTVRITKVQLAGDVIHVFSHIKKTYRVQWVLLEGGDSPPQFVIGTDVPRKEKGEIVRKRPIKKGKGKDRKEAIEDIDAYPEPAPVLSVMWTPLDDVADAKYVFIRSFWSIWLTRNNFSA